MKIWEKAKEKSIKILTQDSILKCFQILCSENLLRIPVFQKDHPTPKEENYSLKRVISNCINSHNQRIMHKFTSLIHRDKTLGKPQINIGNLKNLRIWKLLASFQDFSPLLTNYVKYIMTIRVRKYDANMNDIIANYSDFLMLFLSLSWIFDSDSVIY